MTKHSKEQPLELSANSPEKKYPGILSELDKVRDRYEKASGEEKEKLKDDLQKLSNEKKRLTGDANPPAN